MFAFRGLDDPQVPDWTTQPDLWRPAIEVLHAGLPATSHGLLHQDFHLGNTLWDNDKVTGLIDWAETSWGPPEVDVAHMCSDFAMMHAPADADRFRTPYLSAGGRLDTHPDVTQFWTTADVLGLLPDPAGGKGDSTRSVCALDSGAPRRTSRRHTHLASRLRDSFSGVGFL
jgi:hypothetical protein